MPKRYTTKETAQVLAQIDILPNRRTGEDIYEGFFRGRNRTVVVPRTQDELPAGTFGSILRQANLTPYEFHQLFHGRTTKADLQRGSGPRPHGA